MENISGHDKFMEFEKPTGMMELCEGSAEFVDVGLSF